MLKAFSVRQNQNVFLYVLFLLTFDPKSKIMQMLLKKETKYKMK